MEIVLHGAQHRKDTALWESSLMLIEKSGGAVPAVSMHISGENRRKTGFQVDM